MSRDSIPDIKSYRRTVGLRISDLAEMTGVSASLLKQWERGIAVPKVHELRVLAELMGCDAHALATRQEALSKNAVTGEGYVTRRTENLSCLRRSVAPGEDRIKVLDLFCGSGGFSYGFEQSGAFAVTAGIDLLMDRADTYSANHPTADTITADIRAFSIDELSAHALEPEVVIGGPPCQGFSSIRPFRDRGRGDSRNNLFEEFALVVEALRPRWFVLENVVGLLTHGSGATLKALLAAFAELGYTVDWRIINAANFGLPQNRERLVVVGNRNGLKFRWPMPTNESEHRSMAGARAQLIHIDPLFSPPLPRALTVMEAIGDLPPVTAGKMVDSYDDSAPISSYAARLRGKEVVLTLHEATAHSAKMMEIIRASGTNRAALPAGLTTSGFSSCYSRLEADRPSVTLTVNFVHPSSNKCIHPSQHRALTPREGARIQGFPDGFRFTGTRTQIVKQIGNAVPPILGEAIARALAEQW